MPNRTQTFLRQFKQWNFPPRFNKLPAEQEARLVERIKQLWELNYNNGEMTAFLNSEGWDLTELRLGTLRRKHRLILRAESNYVGKAPQQEANGHDNAANETSENQLPQQHFDFGGFQEQQPSLLAGDLPFQAAPEPYGAATSTSPSSRRKRAQDLQQQSDELLQTNKRRRRIRGLGPLPPDAPGMPPRYKSETSLNECKAFLWLDNERYQALRRQYMEICHEMGISKKRLCEPGQWEVSKDRLIAENAHLSAIMHAPNPEPEKLSNALEIICADVTKRIRVMNTQITMQDANNGLRLNPTQSKQIRHLFYEILEKDDYTSRLEFGDERWEQLIQLWFSKSEILARIEREGIDEQIQKCLNVLTRDAVKRLTDSKAKKDPARRAWTEGTYGPGPGAATRAPSGPGKTPKAPRRSAQRGRQSAGTAALDPTLSMFTSNPPAPSPLPLPIQAEFILAPESRLVGYHPKVWPSTLETCSIAGVHKAGSNKSGAARIGTVVGILRGAAESGDVAGGEETQRLIETHDDLVAYLQAAKDSAGGKVAFLIELRGGYA